MSVTPTPEWMNRYRDTVNQDAELNLIGEWFTTNFKLSFEGNDYLLKVRGGRIEDILHAPRFDAPARFSLRAPMSVWRKFINPDPEPLYHDFFAMLMRVPEFEIDGDSLAAMQNARALHRMMNILRAMESFDA